MDHRHDAWMALCVFEDQVHGYTDQLALVTARLWFFNETPSQSKATGSNQGWVWDI